VVPIVVPVLVSGVVPIVVQIAVPIVFSVGVSGTDRDSFAVAFTVTGVQRVML
jgi:hypothetical protein